MTVRILAAVFVGGGAGAACRYGISGLAAARYNGALPIATMLINVTGCFALGVVASLLAGSHRDTAFPTALLATGFLGGYTTFSTYALEGVVLYLDDSRRVALATIIGPVLAGMVAAAAGAGLVGYL
jgi:CrcB protein